ASRAASGSGPGSETARCLYAMNSSAVRTRFGLIGWALTRANWPLAPLCLAYVLGPIIEESARQVGHLGYGLLLERPIFWIFMVMSGLSIWFTRRMWAKTRE
ncbi:MAG: hypothetical protein QGF38_01870, partial [Rhodospirillales bacterium]|nr:hypothetical protein [Rhodospirillales bacterium]